MDGGGKFKFIVSLHLGYIEQKKARVFHCSRTPLFPLSLQMNYKITKNLEAEFASSSLGMCVLDAQ